MLTLVVVDDDGERVEDSVNVIVEAEVVNDSPEEETPTDDSEEETSDDDSTDLDEKK